MLSFELIKNISSFLSNEERHKISFFGNYEYSIIAPITIYSYNRYIKSKYKNEKLFTQAKWIVKDCDLEMLKDISKKNINLESLTFDNNFNQNIYSLQYCK
jgi:hypothetical protein